MSWHLTHTSSSSHDDLEPLHHLGRRPFSPLLLILPFPHLVPSDLVGRLKPSFCWGRHITIFIFIGDGSGVYGIGNGVEPLGLHIQLGPTMHEEELIALPIEVQCALTYRL